MIASRFLVAGRVQGVYFRASTRREAKKLGVTGSAVNLPDGRVEVCAFGSAAAVQTLAEWLSEGPPQARVDSLEMAELEQGGDPPAKFTCG